MPPSPMPGQFERLDWRLKAVLWLWLPVCGAYLFWSNYGDSRYPRLEHPGSTIRILTIQPSRWRWRPISATLEAVPLSDRPEYDALTYSWGDPRAPKTGISVNGERQMITGNLNDGLKNIRHRSKPVAIWVDQICIDQSNNTEKGSQIPLMVDIYSRAKTVRMWLGNHKGPRWVEKAGELDWHGEWAIGHAKRHFPSARYWLYRLASEEYWKRTWIIQEVGMASNIQVHFGGQQSMPWREFIKIIEWYRGTDMAADVREILRLNALRDTMHLDRKSYSLGNLLSEFYDNYATEPRDKVFAFLMMANECRNGCIDANYTKSKYEIYEDVLTTLNSASDTTPDVPIDMVHLAATIRRSLSRKSTLVPKKLEYFGREADPNTFVYSRCGDDLAASCLHGNGTTNEKGLEALWLDWAWDGICWVGRLITWKHPQYMSAWPENPPFEPHDVWIPPVGIPEESVDGLGIRIRGIISGRVGHVGPSYSSFISDVKVARHWTTEVDFYQNLMDRQHARGINDKLISLLYGRSPYALIKRVGALNSIGVEERNDPVLFFGEPPDVMAGLMPSGALRGDVIVQFLDSDAALVVRSRVDGGYQLVGRALVVKGYEFDWDRPRDRTLFQPNSSVSLELSLDIVTLTSLTLDTLRGVS